MNKWRGHQRKCAVEGCFDQEYFHRGGCAEYASGFCYADLLDGMCKQCKKGEVVDSNSLCRDCEWIEPCVNSCCQNGVAQPNRFFETFRTWFFFWKRVWPTLPKDIFRLIGKLYLKEPARECYVCGPGKWYPQGKMRLHYERFRHVWTCKTHGFWEVSRDHKFFCHHVETAFDEIRHGQEIPKHKQLFPSGAEAKRVVKGWQRKAYEKKIRENDFQKARK